jgi:hypothetical protein
MGKKPTFDTWFGDAFKGLVFVVFALFSFFVHQLNGNISALTDQLKTMEAHQVKTDERVLQIEVSRQVNMEEYKKVVGDVQKSMQDIQDIKNNVGQMTIRIQTLADFVAKRSK